MNELALFAGAGGGLLATHCLLGWRTVCAVEIEPYRREVLLRRQRDGVFDLFPIWDDVRTFLGRAWRGKVDVLTAGLPCQPWSTAGLRKGEADERNLWPDTIRVIREVGPRVALLENVSGLLAHEYFGTILGDLAESGYDAKWCVLGADDLGAPHHRKRLWILAYATGGGAMRLPVRQGRSQQAATDVAGACEEVSNAERRECIPGNQPIGRDSRSNVIGGGEGTAVADAHVSGQCAGGWWTAEPDLDRVVNGLAHRVDRLKALGEGQVPTVVVCAWEKLR